MTSHRPVTHVSSPKLIPIPEIPSPRVPLLAVDDSSGYTNGRVYDEIAAYLKGLSHVEVVRVLVMGAANSRQGVYGFEDPAHPYWQQFNNVDVVGTDFSAANAPPAAVTLLLRLPLEGWSLCQG